MGLTAAIAALSDSEYKDIGALIEAETPDDPVFCLSRRQAYNGARRFRAGFPGLVTYAVKSNPTPDLIQAFIDAGITAFDVASLHEMALVRSLLPDATLHYNNPIRSTAEIAGAASRYGVRHFTVDDREGLERIAKTVDRPADFEIAVRLRPARNMALHDFTSKFGAEPADATHLLAEVAARGFRPALTFHPGSQCTDPSAFVALMFDAAGVANAAGVTPGTVNVGGGFPAPYRDTGAPPLERFFADIGHAFKRGFDAEKTRLVCEPGRALSAPTMSLLTRVKHIRANGDVFLNDGIYGGLMELYMAPIALPVRAWRADSPLAGPASERKVYGPTCDPIDVLPAPLALPDDLAVGDWIEFGVIGAYGTATVTRFNGYGTHRIASVDRVLLTI